ncbi:AraC family transcriptional regulator [Ottowia sp.]|uniref:AraC family transcriptional regulator n=1 Tax=Ottowia sp. TaxID=1898956 RepID=UPI002BFD0DBF|nr:AraC family transcriptional regulator [Ottowia sp.]HOB67706.1 AraC family transcriptional regulator [Ottowia sp.]HPZ58337.1 AraC family transcriptional regulator [Ottowia sp.]HQD48586.1 AraC family transcriptional regulator [Ottowia sp.]
MHQHFSTHGLAPHHEFSYWRDVIDGTYFHLQLDFKNDDHFDGQLDKWELPTVCLSRLESSPLKYKRLRQQCQHLDRQVLVTVPVTSEVEFSQLGRHMRCLPGQFLLEYSDEPYEFSYGRDNLLWVLKLPESALQARLGNASRYCARAYDAQEGVGQLFRDYVQLLAAHCANPSPTAQALMGAQVVDLLALALRENGEIESDHTTVVRSAHLARVEAYIRAHLFEADLTPARIAQACGISLRYLHALFQHEERSVAESVRARRLQAAYEQILTGACESVASAAYGTGFGDQAQFSRLFRQEFGINPSDLIKRRK